MADSESESNSESHSHSSSPKAKSTKVNFVLLKQILDDDISEITDSDDQEANLKENQSKSNEDSTTNSVKEENLESSCGPVGRYPVTFSKRCKSKSCQTRLSAFPLFSVPEDTEWISEEEDHSTPRKVKRNILEKKRKKRRNSSETKSEKKIEKETNEKPPDKTKNPDGTRKDFSTEHLLKETKNPILQAWIQQKNKLARKARREERKEKRAQRAALHEEERLKLEQHEISDKKVKDWFKTKRKEARKLWRQNHPRISPFDMALDDQTEPPPPPEYKVVKTFQHSGRAASASSRRRSSSANSSTINQQEKDRGSPNDTSENVHSKLFERRSEVKDSSKQTQRPKTARPAHSEAKTKPIRPKTAKSTSKSDATKTTEETPKLTKSLSYDDWLKAKREQDKRRLVQQKQDSTDSHLDSVISKLGKQRVKNILSSRKQIDTGLKNFTRSSPKQKSPSKEYSYRWKNGQNLPRPEPQGCDCTEAEHTDNDSTLKAVLPMSNSSPLTPRRKAVEFCKEVTEKCDDLKPSMDKVLAVLDSEIKKSEKKTQKTTSKTSHSVVSTTNATCNDTEEHIDQLSLPGSINDNDKSITRPKSARPKSARPGLVNNTSLTSEQAKKKIFHDMNVLGLCNSEENLTKPENSPVGLDGSKTQSALETESSDNNFCGTSNSNHSNNNGARIPSMTGVKSTVRSNYFDYGTDVDVPTMKSTKGSDLVIEQ